MILLDSIVQPTLSFVSPIITTSVFRGLIGLMDSKATNRFSLMASQAFSRWIIPGFSRISSINNMMTICFGGKFVSITLVENHATSFNMLEAHCRMRRVGFRILFRLLLRRVLRSRQFLKNVFVPKKVLSCGRWLLLKCNKKKVTKWTQIVKRACHTEWSFFLASRWRKKSAMPAHWKCLSWHACNELCKKTTSTSLKRLNASCMFHSTLFWDFVLHLHLHPHQGISSGDVKATGNQISSKKTDPKGIVIWVTCFIPNNTHKSSGTLPKLYLQAMCLGGVLVVENSPRSSSKIIQKSAEGCTGWKLVSD